MSSSSEQEKIRQLLSSKKLEPFISHIRFPQYKNLTLDTKVEFSYPITAMVGANGSNKSSILRALYGCPENNNLGNFWFSTSIDPIEETGGRPNCFIYGYWNSIENKVVEVIKTRIKKEGDPDYWEPSRPLKGYGMVPPKKIEANEVMPEGRSQTRWNAMKKNVVYIDFRSALSAFDKFFYHGELRSKESSHKNKKDFIRSRAPHLKRALEEETQSHKFYGHERIVNKENSKLTLEEVKAVSEILGRRYNEINYIRHTFFNCDAYTCLMRIAGLSYTEAFAGSGEFAVVKIVMSVLRATEKSLILLDEPEVSLHPGAQDRLIDFLTQSVKRSKHQVVISTHSPSIVRKLPPDAIKVLTMDKDNEKVTLLHQSSLPEEAFFHLGEPLPDKITVLVEDVLAQAIVKRALLPLGEAAASVFDVRYHPGGSQTLWSKYVVAYAVENRRKLLVFFDGDKRPNTEMRDPDTVLVEDEETLKAEILRVSGVDIKFQSDGGIGGGNQTQQNGMRRNFMKWVKSHVFYLPGALNPEAFVWNNMSQDTNFQSITSTNPKDCFEALARLELGIPDFEPVNSADILTTQRRGLATIPENHMDLSSVNSILMEFANTNGLQIQ